MSWSPPPEEGLSFWNARSPGARSPTPDEMNEYQQITQQQQESMMTSENITPATTPGHGGFYPRDTSPIPTTHHYEGALRRFFDGRVESRHRQIAGVGNNSRIPTHDRYHTICQILEETGDPEGYFPLGDSGAVSNRTLDDLPPKEKKAVLELLKGRSGRGRLCLVRFENVKLTKTRKNQAWAKEWVHLGMVWQCLHDFGEFNQLSQLIESCQEKYDNIPVKDVERFFYNKKVFEALREVYAECVKNSVFTTLAHVAQKSQSRLQDKYRREIEVTTHDAKICYQILWDEGEPLPSMKESTPQKPEALRAMSAQSDSVPSGSVLSASETPFGSPGEDIQHGDAGLSLSLSLSLSLCMCVCACAG
jgi:hypothetical protein